MAKISQNVNIEMLEKLPDGTYKRKYPKTRSDSGVTFDAHLAENATTSKKGHVQVGTNINVSNGTISVPNASTSTRGATQLSTSTTSTSTTLAATPSAVRLAMNRANEAFTSASNGKQLVGNAITGVDDSVVIPTDPTFEDLASAINGISTGKKWASGEYTVTGDKMLTVNNLQFTPSLIIGYQSKKEVPYFSRSSYRGAGFIASINNDIITMTDAGVHGHDNIRFAKVDSNSNIHSRGIFNFTENGFNIGSLINSMTYKWYAFE